MAPFANGVEDGVDVVMVVFVVMALLGDRVPCADGAFVGLKVSCNDTGIRFGCKLGRWNGCEVGRLFGFVVGLLDG